MIEKMAESSGNVIGFKVSGVVTKADYDVMVPEVEQRIKEHGGVRMLLDVEEFKHEAVTAWGADLKFGAHLHGKVDRMAIVGDKK